MSAAGNDPHDTPATVVDGDAIELPAQPPVAGPVGPVAEPEPYAAPSYESVSAPAGAVSSGSGWPDAGVDLSEHPEYVVGAAFGGGLLLALILRKLGN